MIMYCVVDSGDGNLMSLWRKKEHAEVAAKSFIYYRMKVKEVEMCDSEEEEVEEYLELVNDLRGETL